MLKVLEVNNIDLLGKIYNGYDFLDKLDKRQFDVKQAVVYKQSDNDKVVKLFDDSHNNNYLVMIHQKYETYEEPILQVKNVLSISTPALMNLKEYKEADIIHFHMFHNTGLQLYALRKMANEKKVILSLHDPWLLTGRCVHFYDCNKWKKGCGNCPDLTTAFSLNVDHSKMLWNLKKNVFKDLDVDLVVPTKWMYNNIKESPILKNIENVYRIPFGIDIDEYNCISQEEARKKFSIPKENIVMFHRAQYEFKGTKYVQEALEKLDTDKPVTIITCDTKGLLDKFKDKYQIIDLGLVGQKDIVAAMNACDIFLMPSKGESFGYMAIEAMACKKAVIVFDNSALPSVTHAPECGYLVKDRDSDDLAKAMKELIENDKERTKRGKLGYQIVEKEYKNEMYLKSIEDLYKKVSKREHKKVKDKFEDNENVNQFKYHLNDITVRFFGTRGNISKQLFYQVPEKRIKNYEYDFSDLNLQELIFNYNEKFFDIFTKGDRKVSNGFMIRIEKLLYFIKNNPDFIKSKFKR